MNAFHVANDGQEAMNYLKGEGKFADREKYPLPSLVLLDLRLPKVMGLDVLRWIRQQSGLDLVVLILTSSAEEADISESYRLGVNAYLTKPFEASEREAMAKSIKDFWLIHNHPPPRTSAESPKEKVVSFGHTPLFSRNTPPLLPVATIGVEEHIQYKSRFSF